MARVHSFEPIADRNAEVLILGSMPGLASLAAGQYYAHPQNAFWRIMSELLRIDPASPYPARIGALKSARIALWDVLQSCTREGSLDAMIELDTQIANDFQMFFSKHRRISQVFFNGTKAEACFRKHVLGSWDAGPIACARLPSTSPANASWSYAQKLHAWRIIVRRGQPMHGRGQHQEAI
jgi:double-stranded uracil-DNA glycosylase